MTFQKKKISAYEALFEAQKIAFAPVIFQAVRSLRELGILRLLEKAGKQGLTAQAISEELDLSLYGVRTLLESGLSCQAVEVCEESDKAYQDKVYLLSKIGYFLLNDDMTRANMDFNHHVCYQGLFALEDSVRNQRPEGLDNFGEHWKTIYEALPHLPEKAQDSWYAFDNFYSDRSYPLALPIVLKSSPQSLVDIGTNKGNFVILLGQESPEVDITMIDLPDQLAIASRNISNAGIPNNVTAFAMDVLDKGSAFPAEQDIYWMSQFASCFDGVELVSIFQRVAKAMTRDSRLFIMETCWDRQQHEAAAFALVNISPYFTCMANGNSKMYHSEELLEYIDQAGLEVVEITDKLGLCHTLFECRLPKANNEQRN